MKMTTLIIASLCAATFAFGTAQAADQKFGADRHVGMGLSCETCHGPDKANPQEPTIDTCKQCHDVKALVEKTKGERQKFCVHGIIGARQTGASNEHEHQTQFS